MNDEALKLVLRMVVNVMVGRGEKNKVLYEAYLRKRNLHITIREILEVKRERTA